MNLYYITNWAYHSHRDEERRPHVMKWVKAKVDFEDGPWFTIATSPEMDKILASWHCILGLAAKSPIRGVLVYDSGTGLILPHSVESIVWHTKIRTETINIGLEFILNRLKWVGVKKWQSARKARALGARIAQKVCAECAP